MNFRRFLCITLIGALLLTCAGCQNKKTDDTSTDAKQTQTVNPFGTVENNDQETEAPSVSEESSYEPTEAPTEEKTEGTTAAIEVPPTNAPSTDDRFVYTFDPINDTVYTTADLNIRKEPYNDAEIIAVAPKGTALTRVGYQYYWSQIIYEGEIYYVGTQYLTTTAP
ncbi:MAG: hypothetical protein IJA58_05765 [Lachnospiraceae bacterium]|nr:hypothetical protein [Lachnospiraceae bacterium]